MKVLLTLLVSVLAIAVQAPAAAAAQQAAGAGGSGSSDPGRSLDLNIWMGAGHHGRIIHGGQDVSALDPSVGADNSHGQLGVSATFSRRRNRLAITGEGETAVRAESAALQPWALDHRGGVRVAFSLTNRTLVEVAQAAKYTAINPLVGTSLTPGTTDAETATPLGFAHSFPAAQALTSSTSTVVTHTLSRRSALVFTQGFTYSDGDGGGALSAHSGGARFERGLNRHQTLRLGYRLTAAVYDPQNRRYLQSHDIDAGVEYKRGLPFSRGTTLRATTGTAFVTDRDRRTFRVLARRVTRARTLAGVAGAPRFQPAGPGRGRTDGAGRLVVGVAARGGQPEPPARRARHRQLLRRQREPGLLAARLRHLVLLGVQVAGEPVEIPGVQRRGVSRPIPLRPRSSHVAGCAA